MNRIPHRHVQVPCFAVVVGRTHPRSLNSARWMQTKLVRGNERAFTTEVIMLKCQFIESRGRKEVEGLFRVSSRLEALEILFFALPVGGTGRNLEEE